MIPWLRGRGDEAVPEVHGLVWVDLLAEKEIELLCHRVVELSTNNFELVHPARPKILVDLLERRTQELKTILEVEVLAE